MNALARWLAPVAGSLLLLAASAQAAKPFLEKLDLYDAGTDGYALYRIPCIVVTAKGTVLATCEARRTGKSDWDTIDILMRRSTDGGKTWDAPRKIADVPGAKTKNPVALAQKLANADDVTYNNAVLIADKAGPVHMLFCLEYMRCFYQRSDDDGLSWSQPVEITSAFEKFRSDYDWKVLATGPAHGIQLRSGRLVVPVWLSTGTGGHAHRPSVTSVIYSDDSGRTWHAGDVAVPNTDVTINPNETIVVELADGKTMLNVRSESKAHRRLVTVSGDGATGWSKPKFVDELVEPICMASIVRYSNMPGADKNRILFANPQNLERADGKGLPGTSRDRKNLTIRLSYDEAKTWPVGRSLEPGYSAYSDMAVTHDGTILCLYERGDDASATSKKPTSYKHLTLARFNLEWLTDGNDKPGQAETSDYGGQRDNVKVAGCNAFVIHPKQPAPGGTKPWVWYAPTIGHHPSEANAWLLTKLLERGFYVVGIDVGETFANPLSRSQFADFYRYARKTYGLDEKVCLLPQSRGGLNHFNFAADHPDWVRCIVGIYTVGDMRSFPKITRGAAAYSLTHDAWTAALPQNNPIERLAPIAKAKIPILLVHGDSDKTVPIEDNAQVVYDRYLALGGPIELVVIPGKGHEYDPGFFESQKMLDFLLAQGLQAR